MLRNDVVESVEKGFNLRANRARHFHLTDEFHVFLLILLRHRQIQTVLFQLTNFTDTKLFDLRSRNKTQFAITTRARTYFGTEIQLGSNLIQVVLE